MKKQYYIFITVLLITYNNFAQNSFKVDSIVSSKSMVKVDTIISPPKYAYLSDTDAYKLGMKDAQDLNNYSDGAGRVTFFTSSFFTPIVGVIPVIAYNVRKPDKKYFNYPTNAPKDKIAYKKGFERKAIQLRKARALTGYSIATAGWTAFFSIIIHSFTKE